eukprot:jgi/Botrbrau1/15802/Bobra.4_1s0152.1
MLLRGAGCLPLRPGVPKRVTCSGPGAVTSRHFLENSTRNKHYRSAWQSIVLGERAQPSEPTTCRGLDAASEHSGTDARDDAHSLAIAPDSDAVPGLQSNETGGTEQRRGGRRRGRLRTVQARVSSSIESLEGVPDFVVISGPGTGRHEALALGEVDGGSESSTVGPSATLRPQPGWSEVWEDKVLRSVETSLGQEQGMEGEEGEAELRSPDSSASEEEPLNPFEELGVDDRVTANLESLRIRVPTDIQAAAIPRVLAGANVGIKSYTGSGKTLAYVLPVLGRAIERAEEEFLRLQGEGRGQEAGTLQALVVAPSRELAMQIVRVARSLLPDEARGCVQQAIGGANPFRQAEAIKENRPLMVVGTPGRLAELSRSGVLQTHHCSTLVLDEVDQLLAPNFREEMTRITQHCGRRLAETRQTILVSATLTPKVMELCQSWCPDPEPVFIGSQRPSGAPIALPLRPQWGWGRSPTLGLGIGGSAANDLIPDMPDTLEHTWVEVQFRHRVDAVRRAIYGLDAQKVLVFMNYQQRLKDTEFKLSAGGMEVMSLHGELNKMQRQSVLSAFTKGDVRALIVSDVAARGLDIPDCDAVINLELPSDAAHYAHRAGRTGRIGSLLRTEFLHSLRLVFFLTPSATVCPATPSLLRLVAPAVGDPPL